MPETVELDRIAVGFARLLRGAGLDVPLGNTIAFGQALMAVGLERRDSVYWAGHTTLVRRPEDAETYDRAFRAWWEHEHDLELVPPPVTRELSIAFDAGDDDDVARSRATPPPRRRSPCATAPRRCCDNATSRRTPRPSSRRRGG